MSVPVRMKNWESQETPLKKVKTFRTIFVCLGLKCAEKNYGGYKDKKKHNAELQRKPLNFDHAIMSITAILSKTKFCHEYSY